jgi:hypothetical protein
LSVLRDRSLDGAIALQDRVEQGLTSASFTHDLREAEQSPHRKGSHCRIAPGRGLIVLLKNLLLARERLYGVAQWAARCDPPALGRQFQQIGAFNEDCIGRSLDQLFRSVHDPSPPLHGLVNREETKSTLGTDSRIALRSDDTDARHSQGAQGTDREPRCRLMPDNQGRPG